MTTPPDSETAEQEPCGAGTIPTQAALESRMEALLLSGDANPTTLGHVAEWYARACIRTAVKTERGRWRRAVIAYADLHVGVDADEITAHAEGGGV